MSTEAPGAARWLERCLLAFAFCAPLTIALAEPLGYAAFFLWAWLALSGRGRQAASPYTWPILLFAAAVALSAAFGLRPLLSLRKMDRLLLLGVVFAIPAIFAGSPDERADRAGRLAALFVLGATAKALYDLVRIPFTLWRAEELVDENGMPLLFKLGNMREPQMYMVALCFVVGALVFGACGRRRWLPWACAVVLTAAFVLHFKRGAWFGFGLTAALLAVVAGNRKLLVALALCAAVLMLAPQTRERVGTIRNEFSLKMGGRMSLWTRAAPRLLAAHPMGLGWRAVQHGDLRKSSRYVQRGLNHLHNNVLQVTLETGWLGLAAWLNWMGTALYVMWKNVRRSGAGDPATAAVAMGTFGAYCALHFNGVVEYNFGDGEIFMVFAFLMGLSATTWRRLQAGREPAAP